MSLKGSLPPNGSDLVGDVTVMAGRSARSGYATEERDQIWNKRDALYIRHLLTTINYAPTFAERDG